MPDRLKPGQPPLRISELARLAGCGRDYIRKLAKAGALQAVTMPLAANDNRKGDPERRIPVESALALLRDLKIIA